MPIPEPTRVVLLRHGQTAWNAEQRIQGQLDVALDDTGRRQALRLAQALADEPCAAVYSSDLLRARETAAPLAAQAGLAIVTDAGLRERGFGDFEGRTYAEIEQRWPEQALRWRRREPDFGPGGGETLAAFYRRSVDAALRLASAHAGAAIVIVAHGGVLDCLYRAAAGIGLQDARTWQLGNAAINRLLWTPQGFSIVGWGDRAHLDDDGVPGA
jgi:probable phosphoglycerate mutase